MKMRVVALAAFLALAPGLALAKLPAPAPVTDEQKAKAEETKKKAAEAAKKDADLLSKYQDKAAENYKKNKGIKGGAPAKKK